MADAGERPHLVSSIDALHEAARAAAGSDDFGDPGYLEGLRVLAEAYDRESRLTATGIAMVEQQLTGILKNRLVSQRAWKARPQILEIAIHRPIFVLGLPRTGTTALHHLLGRDPGIQVLEYWLAASPRPRPPRSEWESDPAYQQSVQELEWMYTVDPSLKAIHLMSADGPEECRHLMQQTFTDDTFDCNSTIPSYSAWYARHPMRDTYERHRDLLKLIGSPTPERRWVLKYPVHMGNLRALFAVYPDACIVQCHRDPAKIMPSLCSLVAGWRALYEGDVDRREISRWLVELWSSRLVQGLEVRREHDAKRFFDLNFREVWADPIGSVRRMYDHFGLEMSPAAEQGMRAWVAENPQGKHGEHRYRAEDFGLSTRGMHASFADYMEHFHVEREAAD
jgi:hypothetical protein